MTKTSVTWVGQVARAQNSSKIKNHNRTTGGNKNSCQTKAQMDGWMNEWCSRICKKEQHGVRTRNRDRPRHTCTYGVTEDTRKICAPNWRTQAQDRAAWRKNLEKVDTVSGLCHQDDHDERQQKHSYIIILYHIKEEIVLFLSKNM